MSKIDINEYNEIFVLQYSSDEPKKVFYVKGAGENVRFAFKVWAGHGSDRKELITDITPISLKDMYLAFRDLFSPIRSIMCFLELGVGNLGVGIDLNWLIMNLSLCKIADSDHNSNDGIYLVTEGPCLVYYGIDQEKGIYTIEPEDIPYIVKSNGWNFR